MCNNIESKVCGSLMGVMIGDAMGMSVESMSYQSIKMMGGINGFRDSIQTKISDTKNLIAGTTTDDWQLSKAVAKSLIRRGKFDFTDQVLSHVSALEEKSVGWGKSIETGLMEVKSYLDSRGVHGRSPLDPVVYGENSGLGAGNGVAMKVAPYALGIGIHYLSGAINPNVREEYGKLFTQVRMIGELTHSYKSAIAGAYSIASIVLDNMIGYKKTCNDQDIDNLINKIELNIPHKYTHNNVLGEDNFMIQLNILKDKRLLFGDFEKLLMITGNNSTAMQSCCLAIAIYFRHFDDFRAGILEAVNAGGDTDTIGSMVGAMIGSRVGVEGIPEEWRNFASTFKEALDIGEQMCHTMK